MKIAKRILIGLVVLIVLVVGFLLAAPIIFKDQIVANVKSSINSSVNAEVDFADVDVSFLRSFPDIALTVSDYKVIGVDTFANLPLMTGEEARVDLGFWSVVAGDGNYNIDAVTLERPFINLLVLTPELANYLIVPEGADAGAMESTESAATITLDHYEVHNGTFVYDDRTTETFIRIEGLETEGNGDFTASIFDLDTYSTADALTLSQGGITYLDEVKAVADAVVNVDADNFRYTFKDNDILLNELALVFSGSIDLEENDDILFDLAYSAPANDFRQLWSMIPATYTEGFERVQTGGSFTLNGTVNGAYNAEREIYPAFTVNSDITNGSVQYPGRPVAINGIDAELKVNSPDSNLDRLVVDIPRFNFNLGGDPFRGMFRLATPMSDPNVNARLDGTLDLEKWASAIPLEGVSELAGRIVADITMNNVRQSAIDAGRYAEVDIAGDLLVSNLIYVADGMPAVRVAQAKADFTPQFVDLQQFTATLGRSDVSASGKINNILAYFSPDQTMRGSMTVRSNFFDADEWLVEESEEQLASPAEVAAAGGTPAVATAEVFDRFDFDIDADINQLSYGEYRPSDISVIGNIKPNRLEIANASATLKESSFSGSGVVNNLFDYTFDDGILTGTLSVRSGFFNVADFMDEEAVAAGSSTTGTAPAATAVIPIPRNIKMDIDMVADRVQYTDITMNNVRGILAIQDGAAVIQDGNADLLGGSMGFTGAYDTADGDEPGFRFAYDLKDLDFSQAFGTLNTFSALAPIGKFISGKFSSELVMEGKLGADLFPNLSSIDAKGLLRTAEARIATFKPLQVIGNALNVEELKNSSTLKDIATVFQVNDGQVTIEPFNLRLAGINMVMSGTHGLNTDMNYNIRAAVPREMIQGNIVTGTALSALDKLAGQAGKLGLNISPGDTLNLNISLAGSIASPRASFNLLGTKDGDQSLADAAVDAVKDQVQGLLNDKQKELQDQVNTQVGAAKQNAQARLDSVRLVAEARARAYQDSLKAAATARAGDALKGVLGGGTRTDSTSTTPPPVLPDAVNDVKKELEKFNPFKRKKTTKPDTTSAGG